jgi:hypothetical protein
VSKTQIPIWLLDIDGVINALDFYPTGWPKYIETTADSAGKTYKIRYAAEVVEFINRVHSEGLAEIRWLTTWEGEANDSFRERLGLPEFPLAGERYTVSEEPWWKGNIAQKVAEEGRQIIWTDDDVLFYNQIHTENWGVRRLIVAPNCYDGLKPDDLRAIEEFIRESA